MKAIKVLLDFVRLSVPAKVEFGRNTVTKMGAAGVFPTPDVTYAILTTACNNLETAFNNAQGGGKHKTALLHQAEKEWDRLMHIQATYVDRISAGNEATVLSAGFHPSHQPIPRMKDDFSVVHGEQTGVVVLKCKAIRGRVAWVWEYCEDPVPAEDGWKKAGTSLQSIFEMSDLKPFTRYWFRVACVLKEGQQDWKEPVSIIVY
ncbi:MAG: fibronectin type III domain-containing protein [Bacteroidales bacterium]|nr:fibronectin type III domain-containing protein [Bacteroidales bacterium]